VHARSIFFFHAQVYATKKSATDKYIYIYRYKEISGTGVYGESAQVRLLDISGTGIILIKLLREEELWLRWQQLAALLWLY
jgi:hypothetical protein